MWSLLSQHPFVQAILASVIASIFSAFAYRCCKLFFGSLKPPSNRSALLTELNRKIIEAPIEVRMEVFFDDLVALDGEILKLLDSINPPESDAPMVKLFYALCVLLFVFGATGGNPVAGIATYLVMCITFCFIVFFSTPAKQSLCYLWPVIFFTYPFLVRRYPRLDVKLRKALEHCHYHLLFSLPSQRRVLENLELRLEYQQHLTKAKELLQLFQEEAFSRYLEPLFTKVDLLIQNVKSWPVTCDPLLCVRIEQLGVVTDLSDVPETESED